MFVAHAHNMEAVAPSSDANSPREATAPEYTKYGVKITTDKGKTRFRYNMDKPQKDYNLKPIEYIEKPLGKKMGFYLKQEWEHSAGYHRYVPKFRI